MIQEVGGGFVISSHRVWRPGSYATRQAAQYAFRFTDEQLSELQGKVAPDYITMEMLKELRKRSKP